MILDIEGLEVYSLRRKIINKVKNRYNLAEDFLEDIRLKIDDTLLPRKGAIYVCYNISNAHKWYKKIDAKQQYNYYIYKLLLHGKVQWHNSKFYENVFSSFYNHSTSVIPQFDIEYNAEKYWTFPISPLDTFAEGLFWGQATILDRMYFKGIR